MGLFRRFVEAQEKTARALKKLASSEEFASDKMMGPDEWTNRHRGLADYQHEKQVEAEEASMRKDYHMLCALEGTGHELTDKEKRVYDQLQKYYIDKANREAKELQRENAVRARAKEVLADSVKKVPENGYPARGLDVNHLDHIVGEKYSHGEVTHPAPDLPPLNSELALDEQRSVPTKEEFEALGFTWRPEIFAYVIDRPDSPVSYWVYLKKNEFGRVTEVLIHSGKDSPEKREYSGPVGDLKAFRTFMLVQFNVNLPKVPAPKSNIIKHWATSDNLMKLDFCGSHYDEHGTGWRYNGADPTYYWIFPQPFSGYNPGKAEYKIYRGLSGPGVLMYEGLIVHEEQLKELFKEWGG